MLVTDKRDTNISHLFSYKVMETVNNWSIYVVLFTVNERIVSVELPFGESEEGVTGLRGQGVLTGICLRP